MTEEITIGTRLFAVYPYRKNTDASEFEVIGETRKSWIVGAISSRDGTISSNIIYKVAKDTMRERGSKYPPLQFVALDLNHNYNIINQLCGARWLRTA